MYVFPQASTEPKRQAPPHLPAPMMHDAFFRIGHLSIASSKREVYICALDGIVCRRWWICLGRIIICILLPYTSQPYMFMWLKRWRQYVAHYAFHPIRSNLPCITSVTLPVLELPSSCSRVCIFATKMTGRRRLYVAH
mmetsp:Transcript_35409/g.59166  ORF Transcript_35409/g.59166 Transcript_35409/m.59166 type:complete len:138 (-) Transcript_35409:572-985(-)